MPFRGMKAEPPSRQQLQQWEQMYRFIDAEHHQLVTPLLLTDDVSVHDRFSLVTPAYPA